ncbi:MAG: TadE/TadG family type IV pilus assembly protein [Sphingomonas sp.]
MTALPSRVPTIASILRAVRSLRDDRSGAALMEFAFTLPVLLIMIATGAEMTNYITTRMRVSQLATRLADDAARMGNGSLLAAKTITEADINDLFIGANLQSGELALTTQGRVILSDLEPVANPNTTNRYKIVWQRCYGGKTSYTPSYGRSGDTNLVGMGPTGRQITAQSDNATMFVEVYYEYRPLIAIGNLASITNFTEISSMAVRDRRDLSDDSALGAAATHPNGIYKVPGVTASTCS